MERKLREKKELSERFWMMYHMNEIMKSMSNENAYYNNWILQVPDEATENDLQEIADDDDQFNETCDVFFGICKRFGHDGVYVPKQSGQELDDHISEICSKCDKAESIYCQTDCPNGAI